MCFILFDIKTSIYSWIKIIVKKMKFVLWPFKKKSLIILLFFLSLTVFELYFNFYVLN